MWSWYRELHSESHTSPLGAVLLTCTYHVKHLIHTVLKYMLWCSYHSKQSTCTFSFIIGMCLNQYLCLVFGVVLLFGHVGAAECRECQDLENLQRKLVKGVKLIPGFNVKCKPNSNCTGNFDYLDFDLQSSFISRSNESIF
jgi:hypothetical protein